MLREGMLHSKLMAVQRSSKRVENPSSQEQRHRGSPYRSVVACGRL
jgi:hypothetical protein